MCINIPNSPSGMGTGVYSSTTVCHQRQHVVMSLSPMLDLPSSQ